MKFTHLRLVALLVISVTGCSGDPAVLDAGIWWDGAIADASIDGNSDANSDASTPDASSVDASTVDASTVDAAGIVDASGGMDAFSDGDGQVVMIPDAGIGVDGGLAIGPLCTNLCNELNTCLGGGLGTECATECALDLGDCTATELAVLQGCATSGCAGIESCVTGVACVGDGVPPSCGDGTCSAGEDCGTCAADCGSCTCGDGTCSVGECTTCSVDCAGGCPQCVHDVCTLGPALEATCESCVAMICAVDSFCCNTEWDSVCIDQVPSVCNKDCGGGGGGDGGVPPMP